MSTRRTLIAVLALAAAAGTTWTLWAQAPRPRTTTSPARVTTAAPRPAPVAETPLLMDGLALPNFRGLERILREKPADDDAWTFARGQALLIAETGNLLLLRPPHNKGEQAWLTRAGALRTSATRLARSLATRDFEASRKGLSSLASACNACHQTFRAKTRVVPFAEPEDQ